MMSITNLYPLNIPKSMRPYPHYASFFVGNPRINPMIMHTMWGPQKIAKLVQITLNTLVYSCNYGIHGLYTPTFSYWGL